MTDEQCLLSSCCYST